MVSKKTLNKTGVCMGKETNEPERKSCVIESDNRRITRWINGYRATYKFTAKVFDTGSKFGINGGRISKLCIWNTVDPARKILANYDRGWDIEPMDTDTKIAMDAIIDFLELLEPEFND
jgi:hypothetical protein